MLIVKIQAPPSSTITNSFKFKNKHKALETYIYGIFQTVYRTELKVNRNG